MLIMTGVSIILFMLASLLTVSPLYFLNATCYLIVLSLTQFFSITTVAAQITLFKNVAKSKIKSSGSCGALSSTNHIDTNASR